MQNIAFTLREAAEKLEDKTGLIEAATGRKLSFRELENRSDAFAATLTHDGVEPGDRVMLMVKPSADFICLAFALFKVGAITILIDPGMGYRNLLRCIDKVRPDIFIGIPKACLVKRIFSKHFSTIKKTFCVGFSYGFLGKNILNQVQSDSKSPFEIYQPAENDLAAIIFTTGSTGPPKGVRYEHSVFSAQLEHIRNYYRIGAADIDQPAFPLFALFSTALGACAVIPDMDPTKPALVDPHKFTASISKYEVSYSFGSPALWNVVSQYCMAQNIRLNTVKKVLMAGAPVSGELIGRVFNVIAEDGEIYTPYGATESLPIVSLEGREIVNETWPQTMKGKGTCVGRPLPGIAIRIIAISDEPIADIQDTNECATNNIGEIIVQGNVVTKAYDNNPEETKHAKIADEHSFWHRMGDTGYKDEEGRIWFCGRKAHRIIMVDQVKYTIPCEAVANNHPAVFRSALVAITDSDNPGFSLPVMILEPVKNGSITNLQLVKEVKKLCAESPLTSDIEYFLVHPSFPVDIRHNAKIFREKLAVWAEGEING